MKYELEYTMDCSQKVLFTRLSTPEGLAEWFADDVNIDRDIFSLSTGVNLNQKPG